MERSGRERCTELWYVNDATVFGEAQTPLILAVASLRPQFVIKRRMSIRACTVYYLEQGRGPLWSIANFARLVLLVLAESSPIDGFGDARIASRGSKNGWVRIFYIFLNRVEHGLHANMAMYATS